MGCGIIPNIFGDIPIYLLKTGDWTLIDLNSNNSIAQFVSDDFFIAVSLQTVVYG